MITLTPKPLDDTIAKVLSLITEDEKASLILTSFDDEGGYVITDQEATGAEAVDAILEFSALPHECTLKKYRVSQPSFSNDEANELLDNYGGCLALYAIDKDGGMFDLWMVVK